MKSLWKRAGGLLKAIHRDEQGANMVEYVLIIAAVALPILAIILIYRNDIMEWVKEQWDKVRGVPDATSP
jgi:Flp pilus assembly pilin Flp